MSVKTLRFCDLTAILLLGRWFEECIVETADRPVRGNLRWVAYNVEFAPVHLECESFGTLKYDIARRSWFLFSRKRQTHTVYWRSMQDFYTGPFEFESGDIIWTYGTFKAPSRCYVVYPHGFDPPPTPIKLADIRLLAEEID